jgi:chromosome segregation ATPase
MRNAVSAIAVMGLLVGAATTPAHSARAADTDATARVKEMLRRTQEALHQAEAANEELQRAKSEAEQKLEATEKVLEAAKNDKSAQAAMNAKLTAAAAAQADLAHKLGDADDRLAAANTKLGETTQQLAARQAELEQVKQALERSNKATSSCEAKNVALYGYAEAVLDQYKRKGVWDALEQKNPVLGLKDVEIQNVVQEYQLKIDSQKIKP